MGLAALTTKYKRRDTYKTNVSTLTHRKEYIIIQSVQILYKKNCGLIPMTDITIKNEKEKGL